MKTSANGINLDGRKSEEPVTHPQPQPGELLPAPRTDALFVKQNLEDWNTGRRTVAFMDLARVLERELREALDGLSRIRDERDGLIGMLEESRRPSAVPTEAPGAFAHKENPDKILSVAQIGRIREKYPDQAEKLAEYSIPMFTHPSPSPTAREVCEHRNFKDVCDRCPTVMGLTPEEVEALEWFETYAGSPNYPRPAKHDKDREAIECANSDKAGETLASCVRRLSASTAGAGE